MKPDKIPYRIPQIGLILLTAVIMLGCDSCASISLPEVDYSPQAGGAWETAAPEAVGLDPVSIQRLYVNAGKLESIHSLLIIKDGYLIAEKYYRGAAADTPARLQSVTKSFTSALAGIAIDKGLIPSVQSPMLDFFPLLSRQVYDPAKEQITLEHLLQMRAGYPWEESGDELFELLYGGFRTRYLADIPLIRAPGTGYDYSNLSTHIAGMVVARAAGTDLMSFAEEHLFGPLGITATEWIRDWDGNYNGHADLFMTPRDMARFGQLYIDDGLFDGERIVSAEWVADSLKSYTEDAWYYRIGRNVANTGYGYCWWSADAGDHRYSFAWGHGGQQIALLEEYNMVVVLTADPLFGDHGGRSWNLEKANLNLVGNFFASLE